MTTQYISGSTGGIYLHSGTYTNPVTVTATGTVAGTQYGLAAGVAWTIQNYGHISGSN